MCWGKTPRKKEEEGMPAVEVYGTTMILKRNPMSSIAPEYVRPGQERILSRPVRWFRNKALRPAGVKAINDIFAYVSGALADVTTRARLHIIGDVMDTGVLGTLRSRVDVDNAITAAKARHAALMGPLKTGTRAEKAAATTARSARIPTYQALARALGAV